jgi:hypothetical protein
VVQVSEWQSWADVATWAVGVVGTSGVPATMQPMVAEWKKQANGDAMRYARQAVAFVQNNIRYVGIEMGEHSHRPHTPDEVVRQRYGDCKDKSLLLATLLRANGIEAHVALVNTYLGRGAAGLLPNPGAFNHAIVRAQLNGKPRWIDPTLTNQQGNSAGFYCPAYGPALVVKAGETTLQTMPAGSAGRIVMQETYRLPSPETAEAAADLKVTTRYEGREAEIVRDDPTANIITTNEHYRLTQLWQTDSTIQRQQFTLYCQAFYNELPKLTARQRRHPVALGHPYEIDYTVRIHLPDDWTVETNQWRIDRKAYTCQFSQTYNRADSLIVLHFTYQTHLDHIPVADVPTYRTDYAKMTEAMVLQLTYGLGSEDGSTGTNWAMVTAMLLTLAAGIKLATDLYQHDINPDPLPYGPARPLGGWLILHCIGLPVSVLLLLYGIINNISNLLNPSIQTTLWELGGANSYLGVGMLYIEMMVDWLSLIGYALCTLLLFRRRTTFPQYFAMLMAVRLVYLVVDLLAGQALFGQTDAADIRDIGQAFVSALIWIPYLYKSTRVKQTFLFRYDGTQAVAPAVEPASMNEE